MNATFNSLAVNNDVFWTPEKLLFLLLATFLIYADLTASPRAIGHCGYVSIQ